jgi:LPS export ABC transporter permease LptG
VLLIAAYYLAFVVGAGLAKEGVIKPSFGIWAANLLLLMFGVMLLPRMEQFRGEGGWLPRLSYLKVWLRFLRRREAARLLRTVANHFANSGESSQAEIGPPVVASFPRTMDLYILQRFLSYFILLMAVFVFLFETFTFFELLDDIARHRIPFLVVVNYFRYLTPYLLYNLAPLAALVGVLVSLGIMSKSNEIVAVKASGISLYRLAVPLFVAGLTISAVMLALDETYLPYANQRQDALRNQIKERPPQTYTRPQRWIFGDNSKLYNYDIFDPRQNLFGGLTVLEIDPATFKVYRRIFASRARWSDTQQTWLLESGWIRDFADGSVSRYEPFRVAALQELNEPPSYFNREVRQAFQMNLYELGKYIEGLQLAGFDTSALTVQWHVKLAFPIIAAIIVLLAVPFSLLVGARGATTGIAIGLSIAIFYWSLTRLLEAMGGVGQLPPVMAAWSPDIIFFFLGLYFLLKMPT